MSLIHRRAVLSGASALCFMSVNAAFARQPSTGIIFVAASWCPICKRAAPILNVFAQRHGLDVLVASYDARPIAPFPEFVDSRSHPIVRGISRLPTTLVYSATVDAVMGSVEGYRNPQWYLGTLLEMVRQAEGIA